MAHRLRYVRSMTRSLALSCVLLAGCIATPVPEPPNLDLISFEGGTGGIPIVAGPGTVAGEVGVWIVNVDGTSAPSITRSAADGSFSAFIDGMPGDELRLQVRTEDARSNPVDVRPPATTATVHPLDACLTVPLELDLGEAPTGTETRADLSVRNECSDPVRVALTDFRVDGGPFDVTFGAPLDIAPGAEAAVSFGVRPTAIGPVEAIARVSIDAPSAERRVVTLLARGRAP